MSFKHLFLYLAAVAIGGMTVHAHALQVDIVVNRPYHEAGDEISIRADIASSGDAASADFYFALGYADHYYFHPSWGEAALYTPLELAPGERRTIDILPLVRLPDELPLAVADLYAIFCAPGTYEPVSELALGRIFLQGAWPTLPKPDPYNCLNITAESGDCGFGGEQAAFDAFGELLRSVFPPAGPYVRLGTAAVAPVDQPGDPIPIDQMALKARNAGLALGIHNKITDHHSNTVPGLDDLRLADRRNTQWDPDGSVFVDQIDDRCTITPSRMAPDLLAAREQLHHELGEAFAAADAAAPDTLVWLSGPIEVELHYSWHDEPHYTDYSPFAVAEFRDWLRHRGIYDGLTGAFAGEGVPDENPWGTPLLDGWDFSNDPSPAVHIGPGPSFNEYFGTDFTTWQLRYWDPEVYPGPLDYDIDPLPGPGETGHIAGGFDPPRAIGDEVVTGGNALYVKIWDGIVTGELGFRQNLVWNYVKDSTRWLAEAGVPAALNFSHQIPTDFLGNPVRNLGSASPCWTSWTPYGRAGLTTFFDTTLNEPLFQIMDIFAPGFGLFEYHPDPFQEHDQAYFEAALELAYKYRAVDLALLRLTPNQNGNYGVLDTPFETALQTFLQRTWPGTNHRRFDQPYANREWIDYLPPSPREVVRSGDQVVWSEVVWPSRHDLTWTDWGEFDHFEVHWNEVTEFVPNEDTLVGSTAAFELGGLPAGGAVKVLAVSKFGLTSRVDL